MNIYHVFIDGDEPFMIALALYSFDQALLIASSFPTIAKIETWNGDSIYERRTVH